MLQKTNPGCIMGIMYESRFLSERCVCVFKEGINLASYTFACFLAPKPDLWTAGEEPPGTMSSLHNIWLVFQWSKPTRHYESNADENMFSTVNQQAFGGEEGLLVGEAQGAVERIWVTLRGKTTIQCWRDTNRKQLFLFKQCYWFKKDSYYLYRFILFVVIQSYLPAQTLEKNKIKIVELLLQLTLSTGFQSFIKCLAECLVLVQLKTNHRGGYWLAHSITHCRERANKVSLDGRKRQEPASAEGSMKHRRRHNARAGSPSASHWLSEIKEDVNSSLTRA